MGAICMLATVLVATPVPASAAPGVDEYTLNLPDGGGSDGGEETTTAPAPVYSTTPTYETYAPTTTATGGKKKRKPPEELAPALTASSPNATLGPAKTPTLAVRDEDGGVPVTAIALAVLAAGCCVLAVWRLRFLRELPAAPRRRAPRSAI